VSLLRGTETDRVEAVASRSSDSAIAFEVWMPPAAAWNGKFLAVGNNGIDGAIDYGTMAGALARGYATAGSDAGHVGGDLRFADGHPEKIVDRAYRAVHATAVVAKLVVRNYEGRFPSVSYFQGCNTGGHQALSAAPRKRFPADFDGIIAGAPANDRINEIAAYQHMWQAPRPNGVNVLNAATFHVLGQAVMKACDGLDSVTDGVIDNPLACRFDPKTLQCGGAADVWCLTDDQVTAVERIYAGLHNPRTRERIFDGWPGFERGRGPRGGSTVGIKPRPRADVGLGRPLSYGWLAGHGATC
jgi:feruloyl esterase